MNWIGEDLIMIEKYLNAFFDKEIKRLIEDGDIYNEFSLQHELGIYLREKLGEMYKVQFERNVADEFSISKAIIKEKDPKKWEMDICIKDKQNPSIKYAIELKHPRNEQCPEQMYSFVKDIYFAEWLKKNGFAETYCITLVDDSKFYKWPERNKKSENKIYEYFRNPVNVIQGTIEKPTGKNKGIEKIKLENKYLFEWKNIEKVDSKYRYYVIALADKEALQTQ